MVQCNFVQVDMGALEKEMSLEKIAGRLNSPKPGEVIVYHHPDWRLNGDAALGNTSLKVLAMQASERGAVHLVQKRIRPADGKGINNFAYLAIGRQNPSPPQRERKPKARTA